MPVFIEHGPLRQTEWVVACDSAGVTFKYKDYRADGPARYKVMKLATGEFIRRFLIHVLPGGFHRIRHPTSVCV